MNHIFEDLKERVLYDLQDYFPLYHFHFYIDPDVVMAYVAEAAEEKPDDLQPEDYVTHAMIEEERMAMLRKYYWGFQALAIAVLLEGETNTGELTPRQVRARDVLRCAGKVSMNEAFVIFLETKNAHEFSVETEILL